MKQPRYRIFVYYALPHGDTSFRGPDWEDTKTNAFYAAAREVGYLQGRDHTVTKVEVWDDLRGTYVALPTGLTSLY